MNNKVK